LAVTVGAIPTRPWPPGTRVCRCNISEEAFQQKLAPHFDPRLGTVVMRAAATLRNALWSAVEHKDLDTEPFRDDIYDAVISAFDDELELTRDEERTLDPRVVVSRDRMAY
jgi:hypothetical protein